MSRGVDVGNLPMRHWLILFHWWINDVIGPHAESLNVYFLANRFAKTDEYNKIFPVQSKLGSGVHSKQASVRRYLEKRRGKKGKGSG